MKRKLVFATNNAHKLEEVAAILGDKVELLSLNDIDCHTDIPETAETLEGNALLKSSFIYRNYQLDCFADDTGLEVECTPPVMPKAKATMLRRICASCSTNWKEKRTGKRNSALPFR